MFYYYYTSISRIHVQRLQVCDIDIHMPWCFAAFIPLSSTLCIFPNAISSLAPYPWQAQCVMFPSLCPYIIIVLLTLMSEWEHVMFRFLFLCQFAENDGFQLYPIPCKRHELILLHGCVVFHVIYVPHFLYPVYHWWALGLWTLLL